MLPQHHPLSQDDKPTTFRYVPASNFTTIPMKSFAILTLATLAICSLAQSPNPQPPANQNPQNGNQAVNDAENRIGFWDCTLPGGNFTIALGKICSVSIHEYAVAGGRVTEAVIDTEGSVCARFYYMEPMNAGGNLAITGVVKERLNQVLETAADRTGTDKVWKKVQKDYPVATHAHTVDYRLQSAANLQALFNSAKTAWLSGRGRSIRITE